LVIPISGFFSDTKYFEVEGGTDHYPGRSTVSKVVSVAFARLGAPLAPAAE
jgi:hypothetical protein